MSDNAPRSYCSMCGHEVRIVSGDEGRSHYEPVERSAEASPTCLVCEGWGAYCDEHRPKGTDR